MVIPVLAIAAVDYPDYSFIMVGVAVGGYGLTQAILQIPMGILSDKLGRKPIICGGLLLFALGSLIAAMADTMTGLVLGRILQGAGAIAGAVMALAADATRESQRTKVMAIIGVSIGFSFYLALIIGPPVASSFGLQGIFLATAVLALACIPLVLFGIGNFPMQASEDTLPNRAYVARLFVHPQLSRLNVSVLILHLLITLFFIQIPGMLSELGIGLERHWHIYTPVLFVSVGLLVLMMQMRTWLNQKLHFAIPSGMMALAFIAFITIEPSVMGIIIASIVFFAGFNYLEAVMPAMVSSIAPAGRKGSAMGNYASCQFFGAFLGGVLAGVLNQIAQAQVVFVCALVGIGFMTSCLLGMPASKKVKRLSFSLQQHETNDEVEQLVKRLQAVCGVDEVVVDRVKGTLYLKIDVGQIDKAALEQELKPIQSNG